MNCVFLLILFCLGAVIGSFVCCQARRLRLKETKNKKLGNRSVCLHCGRQLTITDNIPLVSWLILRGKCRHCHKKIGATEFIAELVGGVVFLLIGLTAGDIQTLLPLDWAVLAVTLIFVSILGFLSIYDGLWGELPQSVLITAVIFGLILSILKYFSGSFNLLSALGGVGVLAGIYFLLYFCSKEKLVGGGDWILGLAIALALSDAWLATLVMFFSNALAAIVMFLIGRAKPGTKIYFGPWLVLGYLIVLIGMETFVNFL